MAAVVGALDIGTSSARGLLADAHSEVIRVELPFADDQEGGLVNRHHTAPVHLACARGYGWLMIPQPNKK